MTYKQGFGLKVHILIRIKEKKELYNNFIQLFDFLLILPLDGVRGLFLLEIWQ